MEVVDFFAKYCYSPWVSETYYNDNEPYVCSWLENLIGAGQISGGRVDRRPIQDVQPSDLADYKRAHFFAGIAGWDLALQLAGWPTDREVWTGSCPCQPFSVAGKRKGTSDERHLWPEWFRLIKECKPATIFGEQVASKAGREWLAGVFADLEGVGYAVAGADLCAAGFGAAHIRQRLYWVAYTDTARCLHTSKGPEGTQRNWSGALNLASRTSYGPRSGEPTWFKDGSCRRTEPGVALLVNAVPGRMEPCAAIGNSIVPQVAAVFIQAVMDVLPLAKKSA